MCVLYTYATCQGVLTTLGSYNQYNRNCYRSGGLYSRTSSHSPSFISGLFEICLVLLQGLHGTVLPELCDWHLCGFHRVLIFGIPGSRAGSGYT